MQVFSMLDYSQIRPLSVDNVKEETSECEASAYGKLHVLQLMLARG